MDRSTVIEADEIAKLVHAAKSRKKITLIEPRNNHKELYPITPTQQRFWYLSRIKDNIPYYNAPIVLEINGEVDSHKMRKAFNATIKNHEIFKIRFIEKNGEIFQTIDEKCALTLEYHDLTQQHNQDQKSLAKDIIKKIALTIFNLEIPPLIKACMIKLGDKKYTMAIVVHHIIFDGGSIGLLLDDLFKMYNDSNLSKIDDSARVQFIDYVEWSLTQNHTEWHSKQLDYWKNKLHDTTTFLPLPTDMPRPPIMTHKGKKYTVCFPSTWVSQLYKTAELYSVTPFMMLVAVLNVLLYRYTGKTNINIGTPVANRKFSQLDTIIGPFINTVVINSQIKSQDSFVDLLKQIRNTTIEAYENQDLPFESIIQEINFIRSNGYTPLFQVMIIYQNSLHINTSYEEFKVNVKTVNVGTSKFDLTWQFMPVPEGLELEVEYNTDIFIESTIIRMVNHFQNILMMVIENTNTPIKQIDFLTIEEKNLFKNLNNTKMPFDLSVTIDELFTTQAQKTPDNIALTFKSQQITYQDLDKLSTQFANYLQNYGIGPSSIIGIYFERSIETIICILGILKAGGTYLPIDIGYPKQRVDYIVKDSNMSLLISTKQQQDYLQSISIRTILIDEIWEDIKLASTVLQKKHRAHHLAYIIYTSGSTGNPKGVQVSHKNVVNCLLGVQKHIQLKSTDRWLAITTITFDIAALEIYLPLATGAEIVFSSSDLSMNFEKLIDYIILKNVTIMQATPITWDTLSQVHTFERCSNLKILCGGEPLSDSLANKLTNISKYVWNLYGPTETTIWATMKKINNIETVNIGHPIANMRAYIFDIDMNLVPIGVTGQLYLEGEGVSQGYLNRADLNNQHFIKNPHNANQLLYCTGDLARYNRNGAIEYIGRIDRQVKIRGHRIEVNEIEYQLNSHPNISNAIVTAEKRGETTDKLIAYYITKENSAITEIALRDYLRKALPEYMIPALFIKLDSIPLLTNGKIDYRKLNDITVNHHLSSHHATEPQDNIEKELLNIWQKVLKIKKISTDDDFFMLGGHSLLAMQLVHLVCDKFKVDISLKELLSLSTIKGLAPIIRNKENISHSNTYNFAKFLTSIKTNNSDPFPLTDVQQAYWVGRNKDIVLGNVGSHVYIEIETTHVDKRRIELAINKLMHRHGMLRIQLLPQGEQKFSKNVPSSLIKYHDFSALTTYERNERILAERSLLINKIYSDNDYPLFDIGLYKTSNDKALLALSIDIIICDAHSLFIFIKELAAFILNPNAQLDPINITFHEYVLAEKQLQSSELFQKSYQYWENRLESLPLAPQLPLKYNALNTTLDKIKFTRLEKKLSCHQWRDLKKIAQIINVTPSTLLLTIFSEIISLWSATAHFVINLTLYNRYPFHTDINKVIGDFTILNILEINTSEKETFAKKAKNIQQQLWNDLDHRYYSGIKVMRELARIRADATQAIIPIVFTNALSNNDGYDASVIDALGKVVFSRTQTPQVYLDHQVYEYHGELYFHWDVIKESFEEGIIDEMFETYCSLLEKLSQDSSLWNDDYSPALPLNTVHLVEEANKTDTSFPQDLLHTSILKNINLYSQQLAIINDNIILTYAQLGYLAYIISNKLNKYNIHTEEIIAAIFPKGWEQITGLLAILLSGGTYLPIDPVWPSERIHLLLNQNKPRFILTTNLLKQKLQLSEQYQIITIEKELIDQYNDEISGRIPVKHISNRSLAYVIYTSGTTGIPKGIAIEHRSAFNTIWDINKKYSVTAQDRIFSISSFTFDLSVYDIFGLLNAGGSIILPNNDSLHDPSHWLNAMQQHKATIWNSAPMLMQLFVDYLISAQQKLPITLRLILLSGDWIPVGLPKKIREISNNEIVIISLGGATETSIWSIYYPIPLFLNENYKSIPYGKPLANQQFYVLDSLLRQRPTNVVGDLYIGGTGLAREYWSDEENTTKSFIYHPVTKARLYKTGDHGKLMPDGNIAFLGRSDNQVKINGYRIELGEIETNLRLYPYVKEVIVKAVKQQNKKILAAFIIKNQDLFGETQLYEFIQNKLPAYMIPHKYIFLKKWPITANGKIDEKKLISLIAQHNNYALIESQDNNNYKETILSLVKKSIKNNCINFSTNLLSLGINSVDIIHIINELEKNMGSRLKFTDFYQDPTVNGIINIYMQQTCSKLSSNFKKYQHQIILDHEQREKFKEEKKWLRNDFANIGIDLNKNINLFSANAVKAYSQFEKFPINMKDFSQILQPLSLQYHENMLQFGYPSFGNAHALQTYIYVVENKITSLDGGTYYYNPCKHQLVPITNNCTISSDHYPPFVYRPIFEQSAFAVFFIAALDALVPLYGEEALRLCTIEAGYSGQALIMSAKTTSIGLHPVGLMHFEPLRSYFKLNSSHVMVHSMLGGAISIAPSAMFFENNKQDEWLDGIIE